MSTDTVPARKSASPSSSAAPKDSHLSHFNLKLNGTQAPPEMMADLLDCTVENDLDMPDMCTIRMHDNGFKWVDSKLVQEGSRVQVEAGGEKDAQLNGIFDGEIVGLEPDMSGHGVTTLILRCFSRLHRLARGKKSVSFVQQTDSDIVRKVGQASGFDVNADPSGIVHEHVYQHNQTDWEFLNVRAHRIGFRLYLQGQKNLFFKKVDNNAKEVVKLDWGTNLRSFRLQTSLFGQVSGVVVRGWDPLQKRVIVGKSDSPQGVPHAKGAGAEFRLPSDLPKAEMTITDRPIHTQAEADALAKSYNDDIGGAFLVAEGLCFGEPKLLPGVMVQINNIGERFNGKYYVTSTTHTYTPSEGYATQFKVTGKRPSSLLSAIGNDRNDGGVSSAPMANNAVVGIVTDNKDPDNLGRVKVKYPWLSNDHTSHWVRITSPMAGSERGLFILPEMDDEVLVVFEHGDFNHPFIIGSLWNGKDKPVEGNDKAVAGGKVNRRTLKSRIGHTLLLDDTDGKGGVTIITCAGHKVFLNDKDDEIIVVDKTGGNKITIKSGNNSVKVECMGDFSVDAKGKVSIKGMAGVDVNTPAIMTLQGSLVKIN